MKSMRLEKCYILIFSIFVLASSLPSSSQGLTSRLIPPTSPKSPFYKHVLEANNISSTTATNIILDRSHYFEWRRAASFSRSANYKDKLYSEIDYNEVGGYVMEVFLGSKLQYMFGTFDTGSEIVWFECEGSPPTSRSSKDLPTFNQSKSSSYKQILCGDEKRCDTTKDEIQCGHYEDPCAFKAVYLDKSYGNGVMATDAVALSTYNEGISELKFGCSNNNSKDLIGVVGAGIGEYSFPYQLSPSDPKFSYCISYDVTKTNMVKFGAETSLMGKSTALLKNSNSPLYYLDVLGIKVNDQNIDVPPYTFEMSNDGTRGFVIDSGTAITSLPQVVFDGLRKKVAELLGAPVSYWIFDICYPPSRFATKNIKRKPSITIQFPEFNFVVPLTGTWEKMKHANVVCLLIRKGGEELISILGYEQLFDVNVGIDPNNSKLYLMRTKCPTTQN